LRKVQFANLESIQSIPFVFKWSNFSELILRYFKLTSLQILKNMCSTPKPDIILLLEIWRLIVDRFVNSEIPFEICLSYSSDKLFFQKNRLRTYRLLILEIPSDIYLAASLQTKIFDNSNSKCSKHWIYEMP